MVMHLRERDIYIYIKRERYTYNIHIYPGCCPGGSPIRYMWTKCRRASSWLATKPMAREEWPYRLASGVVGAQLLPMPKRWLLGTRHFKDMFCRHSLFTHLISWFSIEYFFLFQNSFEQPVGAWWSNQIDFTLVFSVTLGVSSERAENKWAWHISNFSQTI